MTSATGDLTDNHDIYGLKIWQLDSKQKLTEPRNQLTPDVKRPAKDLPIGKFAYNCIKHMIFFNFRGKIRRKLWLDDIFGVFDSMWWWRLLVLPRKTEARCQTILLIKNCLSNVQQFLFRRPSSRTSQSSCPSHFSFPYKHYITS